jgi:hypothetical protein
MERWGLPGADKQKLANPTPTWFGALNNTFTYKGFGLDVMLRYSGGNGIMNFTRQEALFNMSFQKNGIDILNRWTAPGHETDVPKLYYSVAGNMNSTSNASSVLWKKVNISVCKTLC